jgi:hypothetical protein
MSSSAFIRRRILDRLIQQRLEQQLRDLMASNLADDKARLKDLLRREPQLQAIWEETRRRRE